MLAERDLGGLAREYAETYDRESLRVISALQNVAPELPGDRFGNLVHLFFSDLVRIITVYLHIRLERRLGLERNDLLDTEVDSLPYLGYRDLREGIDPERKICATPAAPGLMRRLLSLGWFRPRVLISNSTSFRTSDLLRHLLAAGLCPVLAPAYRLGGVDFDIQWRLLGPALVELLGELEVAGRDCRPLVALIERHMRANLSPAPARELAAEALVTGGLANLPSRLLAAQARRQGLPVIACTHGDADGAVDDPYFGYGEYSYATHLLTFGRFAAERRSKARWLHSFLDEDGLPEVVSSNSDDVLDRFHPDRPIRALELSSGCRLLYVPTSFSGTNTYGPFRTTADDIYWRWHRRVMAAFSEARLKIHPNAGYWRSDEVDAARLLGGTLADVMDGSDAFIFDYVSTAFAQAAATDKPIIYLDFGLRNLAGPARSAIAERCIVIENAVGLGAGELRRRVVAAAETRKSNPFSPLFSLAGSREARIGTLVGMVRRAVRDDAKCCGR